MADDGKTVDGTGGARARVDMRGAAGADTEAGTMREIGGSSVDAFNTMIVRQTTAALSANPASAEDQRTTAVAAFAALTSIAPRNELEGMLAAQLVACHNAAMECFRQAARPALQPQTRAENLAHAGRLSRAYAALVEALDGRRGESVPKAVTIEHRVTRAEPALTARAVPRLDAPRNAPPHTGNGHALNGHTAPGGTALP